MEGTCNRTPSLSLSCILFTVFMVKMLQMPLEGAPEPDLIVEVNSSPLSPALNASATMYQIEGVTFPGMFDVMVYFVGRNDSMCFSTSNQISEFCIPSFSESKWMILCVVCVCVCVLWNRC